MKAEDADLLRWFGDMASALDVALGSADDLPVTYVGHSLGGQAIPFVDHSRVDRGSSTVASGTGYYRHNLPAFRWGRAAREVRHRSRRRRAAGYFPGRRLHILGDVPSGVMRQWGRWCMHPDAWVPTSRRRRAVRLGDLADDQLTFTDDRSSARPTSPTSTTDSSTPTRSASATARPSSRSSGWATTASSAPATRTSGTSWSCRSWPRRGGRRGPRASGVRPARPGTSRAGRRSAWRRTRTVGRGCRRRRARPAPRRSR